MVDKLFGTDGVRAIANTFPLTIDFCSRLAIILSQYVCKKEHCVAIARDTRISADMLYSALCAGFTSQGIDVINLGIIPTPLCTTLTEKLNVDMSIMITASHNPYQDNGLKLINASGDKFTDEQTALIEAKMHDDLKPIYKAENIGKIVSYPCGLENYLQTVKQIAADKSLKGMKIVTDAANGAFSGILANVFRHLGAEVISLAEAPDGTNINKDCGSQHTEILAQTVVENHYDLGIAVDGDGDRIIICDEQGNRLDGDQIIAYLANYLQKNRLLKGNAVISTIYSNLGLGKFIRSLGLDYYATAVGERYVIEKMHEIGANLGGEESGHMVLSDYSKTGDALLCAVVVCLGIKSDGRKVSEIFPIFKPFPAESHNLRFSDKAIIEKIMSSASVQNCIAEIKARLQSHGAILVRKSGTEPVIRIKVEDENAELAKTEIENLLDVIAKIS